MNIRIFTRVLAALWLLSLTPTVARGAAPWTYNGESAWNPPSGYIATGAPLAKPAAPMDATVQENPPQITLKIYSGPTNTSGFSPNLSGTYDVFRKTASAPGWGMPVGTVTVGTSNATWTDTNVTVGQIYEYGLAITGSKEMLNGFLAAGIKADQTQPKGRIAIVVAADVMTGVPVEYAQYKADLVADGWTVHEIPVARAKDYYSNGTGANDPLGVPGPPYPSDHVAIRNQLIALYNQFPGELKSVVLLGKVPVERTGLSGIGPDGHGNVAAMGADAYYADMDGEWIDQQSNAPFLTAGLAVRDYTYAGGVFTPKDYINNADGSITMPTSAFPTSQYYLDLVKNYRLQGGGPYTVNGYPYKFTVQGGLLTSIVSASEDTNLSTGNGMVNVPGDNKFDAEYLDQIRPNSNLELGFSRIDFSNNMPAERESLRTYFNKLHRYKLGSPDFQPARKAIHRTGFGMVSQCCLEGMPGIFGMRNLDWIKSTDLPTPADPDADADAAYTAQTSSAYFYFKGGSEPYYSDGGRAILWTGMQSHWGYWFQSAYNEMARRLSEDNLALSYTWSIGFNGSATSYLYHRMGMGFDAGDMMRISMSSRGGKGAPAGFVPVYIRADSAMFMENMGDPAMRLFMFAPASRLGVVPVGGNPSLSWTASPEPAVIGYHVYRAATANGPFTRLTSTPVAGTAYVDTTTTSGSWNYMVRAIRLETTGGGTFYNASLGIQQQIDLTAGPSALQITTATLPDAPWNIAYPGSLNAQGGTPLFNWTLDSGTLPPGLTLSGDGSIVGKATVAGTYACTARATDALGQTATQSLSLTALSNDTATIYTEAGRYVSATSPTIYGTTIDNAAMRISGTGSTYQAFLRFDLSGVNVHNQSVRARLVLTLDPSTSLTTNALVKAALTEDSGDSWTDKTLTYDNRPLDQAAVPVATGSAGITPFAAMEIDVTRLMQATLANDPAKKLSLRLFTTSPGGDIQFSSRYGPHSGQPRLVIETTDAPALTINSPVADSVSILAGSSLQINASAVAIPARTGSLAVQWSVLSGPGTVSFNAPTRSTTGAVFSTPGDYVLRLAANDGALQSYRDLTVHVLAVPAGTVAVTGPLDGLILRLPFDETSGSTAADTSGVSPAHPGTLTTIVAGGPLPVWNPSGGVAGGAIVFNGTNQRVEVSDSTANPLDGMQKLSASLWVKTAAADTKSHAILVKRTSSTSSTTSYSLTLDTTNRLVAAVANKTPSATSTLKLAADTWYNVVMVFDGSQGTNNLRLYVNGSPEVFATVAGQPTLPRIPDSKLRVGDYTATSPSTTVAGLNGSVDEVRLYNRVLTQTELLDLASATPSNVGPTVATASTVSGTAGQPFALTATVADDNRPGALSLAWNRVTGPGTVAFGDATAASTGATASVAGSQLLRFVANDGAIATFADVLATIAPPALNAYQQWAQAHGLPTDGSGSGALSATPSGDGISNAMKYALGLDPGIPGYAGRYGTGKTTSGGADYLSVTFTRPDPAPDGADYAVETSSDLGTWSNAETIEVGNTLANGLRTITVRDSKPIGQADPRRFIRLNVSVTQAAARQR